MKTKFSPKQIQNLKSRAKKIKSASGINHCQALDQIAIENGFKNWSMLAKSSAITNDDSLLTRCKNYINHIGDEDVHRLCKNGSLWIKKDDVLNNRITLKSFESLGSRSNQITIQFASRIGAVLLTDFDGIYDSFESENENSENTDSQLPRYTHESGRKVLIDSLVFSIDSDEEAMLVYIDESDNRE